MTCFEDFETFTRGEGGTLRRTTIQLATIVALTLLAPPTAHAQWELENSGTKASLRGITNVGGGVAWASGTDGTVLRTEDGGYPLAGLRHPHPEPNTSTSAPSRPSTKTPPSS